MEAKRVEVGLRLPVAGPLANPDAIHRSAIAAEAAGFDALWVHDYIVWTRTLDRTHVSCGSIDVIDDDTVPVFYESLTTLSYLAGITERIRLGIAVLVLPYRNAVVAARQLANIDQFSEGRLLLGVGVGAIKRTNNLDFEVLGVSRAEKYEMTREALQVFDAAWNQPISSFEGKWNNFSDMEFYPKPLQAGGPPVWMAGRSDKGLSLVAEFADGWLPTWLSPDDYRQIIPELMAKIRDFGRPSDRPLEIGTEIVSRIDNESKTAWSVSDPTIQTMTGGFTVRSVDDVRNVSLIGSPSEVVEKVNSYAAAGVSHFEVKPIYRDIDDLLEQIRFWEEDVMPHLDAAAPVMT